MRKIFLALFAFLLPWPFTLSPAFAASTTFYKLGGSGTISNLILAHNGATCSGTSCSNTSTCCISGVSGTSTGTANVAIAPSGNAINTPGVSLLQRYGSIYQWVPLYMPGTRNIPMPPGTPSGGTAPLSGVTAVPQQLGMWCNNVPYGNVAVSMCFPGGQQGKVTGQFSGGVYAAWSCNGGFYAPPVASTPITNHDSCIPVEGGWYSPFREIDRYPCPLNSYCPAAEIGCPVLTANVTNSMIPNKPGCKTVSSATTGTAAAPTFQMAACPDVENCAAAPIACPAPWTLSEALSDAVTDCYYRYDAGCPLINFPHATVVEGRVYNPGGNPQVVCEIKSCETGYAVIDGQCILGCPAGKYMSAPNTCTDCPAGRYCLGGYVMPEDCPSTHPNSLPANPSEGTCYLDCDPLNFPNATTIAGFDYHDTTDTCAATACATNYLLRDGQCILSCPAGQYANGGTCTQCPAGYWCPQNDPLNPRPCTFGNYCAAGVSAQTACPETHPNSQPLATAQTLCYVVAACSATNAATSEMRRYSPATTGGTCVALTCNPGYQVVNWQCVSASNVTVMTLNKNGGTGTILGVTGIGNASMNCENQVCALPSIGTLTRTNFVYNYSSDGTNYPNGRWCTNADGTGTCYAGGQTHAFTNINSITLYAMWSCASGHYATSSTTCDPVGNGYYSPGYSPNRFQCPAGYYCAGMTTTVPSECPVAYPDSAVGNSSSMQCRRPCPELPGVATMVPGGFEFLGMPSTCAAASCASGWELSNGVCLPPDNSCPPGYYFDDYCRDCPIGHYCVGGEEPAVQCPLDFPSSIIRNYSIGECFTPCVPSSYFAVLMMAGREYYDNQLSTCMALVCMNGFSLDNGRCVQSQCPAGQFLNDAVCDTCPVGRWYNGITGSGCTSVGNGYYSPANDARKYECPSDTLSGGDGTWAGSQSDCAAYRTLNAWDGTDTKSVVVRTVKMTTPALHIYDGTNIYYGNVSPSAADGGRQIMINDGKGTPYYLRDNSAM